jgi:pantetheine-phosphate adenylyltransferase
MQQYLSGKAVYAGSFDPITFGHINILERAAKLFDKVVIGVGINPKKKYLFSIDERVDMVLEYTKDMDNVEVQPFKGLLINFAQDVNAQVILRGLRAATDFEYESQMGLVNMDLDRNIETLFLLSDPKNVFISSSTVKEIAYFGGDLERYVPEGVIEHLRNKFTEE